MNKCPEAEKNRPGLESGDTWFGCSRRFPGGSRQKVAAEQGSEAVKGSRSGTGTWAMFQGHTGAPARSNDSGAHNAPGGHIEAAQEKSETRDGATGKPTRKIQ